MNSVVRIGVVGLRHGARHVRGFHGAGGRAEVTAVCDLDSSRATTALADASSGCREVGWAEMLDTSLVDAVVVSLPNDQHAQYAREALEAGLHVAVEKPMCPTGDQARELVRLAEQHELVVAALHDFRVEPAHWAAKDSVWFFS